MIARTFARIHWQNLVNFGVLPLTFADPADYDAIEQGDEIRFSGLHGSVQRSREIAVRIPGKDRELRLRHDLSPRQIELLLAGGVINWMRSRPAAQA